MCYSGEIVVPRPKIVKNGQRKIKKLSKSCQKVVKKCKKLTKSCKKVQNSTNSGGWGGVGK
jgi:hypothetical protein